MGDRVLIRTVGLQGKHKIADRWDEEPYKVLKQPIPDIPVFDVQKEDGTGRVKTLHRNELLLKDLISDFIFASHHQFAH